MQKIGDIPNTRADNNGEFTDGNVAGGVPPTILPAEWFNTIQRELMSILNAAEIESDPHVFNQVLLSIQKLVSEGIPDLKDASLTQKGIVQLSNATTSNSQILAATPKAVSDLGNLLLKITNNLSEIKDAGPVAVAQTLVNLGLGELPDSFGDAASKNVGTTAGTVAAGDDSRIVNAVQPSNPGLCTAWVNFNGVAPATIKSSHNVSSITRLSTGKYKINFTEPMNNINYCPVASMADGTNAGSASIVIMQDGTNIATSSPLKTINDFTVYIRSTGGAFDSTDVNAIVYGGK
ncbi:tail fiber protein [Yersinia enterocolitica]